MEASEQEKRFYQVGNIKSETIITEIRSEKNNGCILVDFTLRTGDMADQRKEYLKNKLHYE